MAEKKDIRDFIGQACLNAAAGNEVETGILGISDGLGTLISESYFLYGISHDDAIATLKAAYDNAKSIIDKKFSMPIEIIADQTRH